MMKYNMKNFKTIADTLLSDLTASDELKQKVVSKCKKSIGFQYKMFLITATSLVILVLFFSNQFFKNNFGRAEVSSSKAPTIINQANVEKKDDKIEVMNEPKTTKTTDPEASMPIIENGSSVKAGTSVPAICSPPNAESNDGIKIVQGPDAISHQQVSTPKTDVPIIEKDSSAKVGNTEKQDGSLSRDGKIAAPTGTSPDMPDAPVSTASLLLSVELPSIYKEGTLNDAKALIGEGFSLPTYLAEGITLNKISVPSDISNKVLIVVVEYNLENKSLTLTAQKNKTIEKYKDYKKVDVNGMEGYLEVLSLPASNGTTATTTSLIWVYKDIQYEFNGDISEDKLIKMAGSIK